MMARCTDCSNTLRPVAAIDIDGTLGDYHGHFIGFAEQYLGRPLPRDWDGFGNWEEYLGITKGEYRDAKLAYRQGGLKRTMPIFPGAKDFMDGLKWNRVEVWLTTTRPWLRLDNVDPDTREWLRRNEVHYDHLLYGNDKYDRLGGIVDLERVVMVMDDLDYECNNAASVFGESVPVQMMGQYNSGALYLGERVDSYGGAFMILKERLRRWRLVNGD